jgi:NTP pyrophosphatase (non-canonical NTP hydrolase)
MRVYDQELDHRDFVTYVQEKSVSRANRWHGGDFRQWSGLEWAGALCGEAGEAANVAKKLRRVELAIDGNAASEHKLVPDELKQALARECADVFLYLVLLAARYDINLSASIVETFNKKSVDMGFPERL